MINEKVFCAYPWSGIHIRPDGGFYSCCVAEPNKFIPGSNTKTLDQLYNSEELKQLRLDLLAGTPRPDVCKNCYKKDAAGFSSPRTRSIKDFSRKIEDYVKTTDNTGRTNINNIYYWDIRHSNLCNLKCRTCNEGYSSSWAAENNSISNIKLKSIENNVDLLNESYNTVRNIYFAGGETLLMPEHFETLTKLIATGRAKEITISYSSNLTKLDYNNNNLIDLWKEFGRVFISISLDEIEEKYNYVRHGVDWEVVKSNIIQLKQSTKEYNNINYRFTPTISIFNALSLTDIHRYLWDNDLMENINDIFIELVMYPEYFAFVNLLPKDLKLTVIDKINNHVQWLKEHNAQQDTIDRFLSVSDYTSNHLEIQNNNRTLVIFVDEISKIDRKRNESFVDTFPELADMFNQYLQMYNRITWDINHRNYKPVPGNS